MLYYLFFIAVLSPELSLQIARTQLNDIQFYYNNNLSAYIERLKHMTTFTASPICDKFQKGHEDAFAQEEFSLFPELHFSYLHGTTTCFHRKQFKIICHAYYVTHTSRKTIVASIFRFCVSSGIVFMI